MNQHDTFIQLRKLQELETVDQDDWLGLRETCATSEKWKPNGDQLGVKVKGPAAAQQGLPSRFTQIGWRKTSEGTDQLLELSLSRENVVPEHILCAVNVCVKEQAYLYPALIELRWLDSKFYAKLEKLMKAFADSQDDTNKRIYKKSVRLTLLEVEDDKVWEVESRVIKQATHWDDHIRLLITSYCSTKHTAQFFIEIRAQYDWLVFTEHSDGVTRTVLEVLEKEAVYNYDKQMYWPKQVFKVLFDEPTIRRIVDSTYGPADPAPNRGVSDLNEPERTDFVKWLCQDRILLLACCILGKVELRNLRNLMNSQHGHELRDNSDWFLPRNLEILLPNLFERKAFTNYWGGCRPFAFPEPGQPKHRDPNNSEIVPVNYNEADPIGEGSFKSVFEATIHADYHELSSNRAEVFALKVIKGDTRRMKQMLQEVTVWQDLIKIPHPRITIFHASWTQNHCFYILSPLADMDLRKFLHTTEFNFKDTGWLLEQLEGVTSAVQHIHHIGRATLELPRRHGEARPEYGYHHDLKPANILVYPGKQWKITDFGTMKVRHDNSGTLSRLSPRTFNFIDGDAEYAGPDYWSQPNLKKGIGQESDVWSLGCIFLEVMLWANSQEKQEIAEFRDEKFRNKRAAEVDTDCRCPSQPQTKEPHQPVDSDDSGDELDSDHEAGGQLKKRRKVDISGAKESTRGIPNFWFMCNKSRRCHRKRCVMQAIRQIKQKTNQHKVWLAGLCDEIRYMLKPDPELRPKASNLLDILGVLRTKALREDGRDEAPTQTQDLPIILETPCSDSDMRNRTGMVNHDRELNADKHERKRRLSQAESVDSSDSWSAVETVKSGMYSSVVESRQSENKEDKSLSNPNKKQRLSLSVSSGHRSSRKRLIVTPLQAGAAAAAAALIQARSKKAPENPLAGVETETEPSFTKRAHQQVDPGNSQDYILGVGEGTSYHVRTTSLSAAQDDADRSKFSLNELTKKSTAPWAERSLHAEEDETSSQ